MSNVTSQGTNTVNKNIIVPAVYSQLVREKITGKCHVACFAKKIKDLQGKEGETLTMAKFKYIGDGTDWTVGQAMSSGNLQQSSTTATVKAIAAPGVKVYDYDSEVEFGNAVEEASSQQAISIARKMDTDAIDCAKTSPLKKQIATKNTVTQAEMLEMLSLYGDDRNIEDFDGIVVYSAFATSFYSMDLFTSTTKTTAVAGNGIVRGDCIGYFLGIPVFLSDRLYDSTNTEGFILCMKKNAIGVIPKEEPFCEAEREASYRRTTIYCSDFYAMALIDDSAIVIGKTVIS